MSAARLENWLKVLWAVPEQFSLSPVEFTPVVGNWQVKCSKENSRGVHAWLYIMYIYINIYIM